MTDTLILKKSLPRPANPIPKPVTETPTEQRTAQLLNKPIANSTQHPFNAPPTPPERKPSASKFSSWKYYVHPKPAKGVLNYRFIKTLGQGSMGKVKLAMDETTGEQVAVKIIPRFPEELMRLVEAHHKRKTGRRSRITSDHEPLPPLPENFDIEYDPQRELRVLREANTLQLLSHPNIVRLLQHVVTDDYYYLVFEYVPGRQLLDWVMRQGKLSEDLCRRIIGQLISGIAYCHANSLVHRDLKIENIMLDGPVNERDADLSRIQVKILDFGLSNFYRKDRLLSTFCGSLYFAAPELLQAQPYQGPEVDIWSLGVIAFVLLAGRVPFDDVSLPVLHRKIKQGYVEYPLFLSRDCVSFLKRMLCVNPSERGTIEELRNHPWMLRTTGKPTALQQPIQAPLPSASSAAREAPFLLERLKNWSMTRAEQQQHQHQQQQQLAQQQQLLKRAERDPYLPDRKPLYQLAGVHPHPLILSLLKRSPFDFMHEARPSPNPSPPSSSPSTSKEDVQEKLRSMGFSIGFGYQHDEVFSVLNRAWQFREGVYQHPLVSLYYLIHEWLQRRAPGLIQQYNLEGGDDDIKRADNVPEQGEIEEEDGLGGDVGRASVMSSRSSVEAVVSNAPGVRRASEPAPATATFIQQQSVVNKVNAKVILDSIPQPGTTNSSVESDDIWFNTQHSPAHLLPSILHILTQEGVSQLPEENAEQQSPLMVRVPCSWKPSIILQPPITAQQKAYWERMSVHWDILMIQQGKDANGAGKLNKTHPMMIRFQYKRGDQVVYRRIMERLQHRLMELFSMN